METIPEACNAVLTLKPRPVFKAFARISSIPRGSGNEEAISDFLMAFAQNLKLEAHRDKALNVIIKKKGTQGYENAPTVILQGHMDMVCEKEAQSPHDFTKDPIRLMVKDEMLTADGTTLGADNGIALAYAMALLESDTLPHPPLEVLITTEEEVGLVGASQLDTTPLSGKILINLDAEEEGRFFVSCCGGTRCTLSLPVKQIPLDRLESAPELRAFNLNISGLKGGHSGMDIHLGRANANVLMGRILAEVFELGAELATLSGGGKVNAIPRQAQALLLIPNAQEKAVQDRLTALENTFREEFSATDPKLAITLTPEKNPPETLISRNSFRKLIDLYRLTPSGVQAMSQRIDNLVETSLNLGVVEEDKAMVHFQLSVRSSVESMGREVCQRLAVIGRCLGGSFTEGASYPAWEYRADSPIRDLMVKTYWELHKEEPKICAIHAGLECGILGNALADMDMIAMGPDMVHVHSPEEAVSIPSVRRTWELLCRVLENIRD